MKFFAVTLLISIVGWAFAGESSWAYWYFAVAGAACWALEKRSGRLLSFPMVFIMVATLAAVFGFVYYERISEDAVVSFHIDYDRDTWVMGFNTILLCIFWFWVAAMLATRRRKTEDEDAGQPPLAYISGKAAMWLIVIGILSIIVYVVGYGYTGLLRRAHYLMFTGPRVFVSLGALFGPAASLALSIVIVHRRPPIALRVIAAMVLALLTVAMFGTGSRGLAAIPLAFLWCWWLIRGPEAKIWSKIVVTALCLYAAALAFSSVLILRVGLGGESGIVTYFNYYDQHPDELGTIDVGALAGNILFGVPLTGDIVTTGNPFPLSYLGIALNPMPGGPAGWNAILDQFSWAPATPYNVYGELYLYGAIPLALTMGLFGLAMGTMDSWVARRRANVRNIVFVIILVLILVFTSSTFQYPVRNSSRFLWYGGVLLLAMELLTGPFVSFLHRYRLMPRGNVRRRTPRRGRRPSKAVKKARALYGNPKF
ncbi:hypothetical protein [Micrococcus sp.]|uniref:hypothetical protein n=1 Tax=Micrococcus sp. TaxID=1271 RepID=UPI0026DD908D|nr:hypothetical protein [Micrococcus sp.]MDO4240845.1 hypothetical protein [Micrococcus sp.]